MVAFFVEVLLKVAVSPVVGQLFEDQLAQVLQLLSAPPPSQVRVAAEAAWTMVNCRIKAPKRRKKVLAVYFTNVKNMRLI
jgi:hypothetical protein